MDNQSAALSSVDVLIEAVGSGSQVALQRLYEIESRRLYGIALRIVRRREIAAEGLQETFLQVWQNAAAFSHERAAGAAWLTGIVRFRALDAVRKAGREVPSDDPRLGDEAVEPDVIDKIGASVEADALRRCFKLLDPKQQRWIVLAFVDGLSYSEVATRIKAPLGSVKSWIRRGVHSLRMPSCGARLSSGKDGSLRCRASLFRQSRRPALGWPSRRGSEPKRQSRLPRAFGSTWRCGAGRPRDLPPLPRHLPFGSLLRPCQDRTLLPSFTPRSRTRPAG